MADALPQAMRDALVEKLADSLSAPLVEATPRHVHEVDFLARGTDGATELIQVRANAGDPATADRELRALAEAGTIHPRAARRLLTLTRDGAPREVPRGVIVQPAHEWMLEAETAR